MTNQSLSDAMFPEKSVANAAMRSNYCDPDEKDSRKHVYIFCFVSIGEEKKDEIYS